MKHWLHPQAYQPATCLLRNTTGSICSVACGWLVPFLTVCELGMLVTGVLVFAAVGLETGADGGLRPAALAKKALEVSHEGSYKKTQNIKKCLWFFHSFAHHQTSMVQK